MKVIKIKKCPIFWGFYHIHTKEDTPIFYIAKGLKSNQLTPLNYKDDFQTLKAYIRTLSQQEPAKFENDEALKEYKAHHALYFISGTIKGNTRNNSNIQGRNLIAVDLDSIPMALDEFLNVMTDNVKKAGFQCAIYPTISQGRMDGLRFRVVFGIDNEATKGEYKTLVDLFTFLIVERWLRVEGYKLDRSNGVYSQLQGLPVVTEYNKDIAPIIQDGEPWEKGALLALAEHDRNFIKWSRGTHGARVSSLKKIKTGNAMDTITTLTAIATGTHQDYVTGNRNNCITQMAFTLRYACGRDARLWQEATTLLEAFNGLQGEPLSTKELQSIIQSAEKTRPNDDPYYFYTDCLKLLQGEPVDNLKRYYIALFNQCNGHVNIFNFWDDLVKDDNKEEIKIKSFNLFKTKQ